MPSHDSLQVTAMEHLRVIRTLMERAHIYRAVSAPAALIGGLLSLGVAAFDFDLSGFKPVVPVKDFFLGGPKFLLLWLGVLAVTGILNFLLLMREARGKGEPVITDGLRMALRGLVPPMLTGGVLGGSLIWFDYDIALGAIVWILCYGLALQAMVSFAPRSLIWLARAFLLTGQVLVLFYFLNGRMGDYLHKEAPASLFMGLTFGLYHIVYAIGVFVSKPVAAETDAERFIEAP